jgi:hypothetical protein
MLPMIIGAGITAATGGAAAPWMVGLGMGGLEAARTGSLERGLMAGLGAYGGAGLAGSLMGAGTGALSSTAGAAGANSAVPVVADAGVQSVIPELAGQGAGVTVTPLGAEAANLSQTGSNLFGGQSYLGPGQGAEAMTVGSPIQAASMVPTTTPIPATTYPTALSQNAADIGNAYAQEQAAQNAVANRLATATPTDKLQAGLGQIGKNPSQFMTKDNLKYGLAALGSTLQSPKQTPYAGSGPNPYNFMFDWERPEGPSYDSREALQLRGRLRPIESMAQGGPVEAMSYQNRMDTMMANGGQMFAEGGTTDDPAKGMTGASADAFRYLMGQSSASPTTLAAQQFAGRAPAAAPVAAAPVATDGGGFRGLLGRSNASQTPNYGFDPSTGQLTVFQAPEVVPAASIPGYDYGSSYGYDAPSVGVSASGGGSDGSAGAAVSGEAGWAQGGIASLAQGGASHLGDYSDGGRLLKGPGDGVSDSIPATIANKRPARLADGEFVVPARIVSELGNGSTEAGARKLYAMMDRVQKARGKTTGKNRVAVNSRADKLLPA